MPATSAALFYSMGFVVSTAGLHAAGIGFALAAQRWANRPLVRWAGAAVLAGGVLRSEEHTSELQSQSKLVCRLLLEKKKNNYQLQSHSNILCCNLIEKKKYLTVIISIYYMLYIY